MRMIIGDVIAQIARMYSHVPKGRLALTSAAVEIRRVSAVAARLMCLVSET